MSEWHFQKHICLLFVSMGVISYYLTMKRNVLLPNKKPFGIFMNDSRSKTYFDEFDNLENNITIGDSANLTDAPLCDIELANNIYSSGSKVVNVLGLFELSSKWGKREEGESEVWAAKIAIERINRLNVIPGYSMNLLVNDTKCDPGIGIDRFFHALYSNRNILVLLGSGCSNVTKSLANIVPYWNIPQVSFGSMSPTLSDRTKFPLFFRTVAPESSHNAAKIEFVKHFGWEVVAAFSQSENDYLLPINWLVKELEKENISCTGTITFSSDDYKEQLVALKALGTNIILASFSPELATRIFCEVFRLGMYVGDYIWIMQHQQEKWWESSGDQDECSAVHLKQATDGLVLVSDLNTDSDNEVSEPRMNQTDLRKSIRALSTNVISTYIDYVYDAVWAIALALRGNRLIECNKSIYYYEDRRPAVLQFMKAMESMNFLGLSGPVKFVGPDRVGDTLLTQIQGGKTVRIAVYDSRRSKLIFDCRNCFNISWIYGRVPVAQRLLKVVVLRVPTILYYIVCSLCTLGIFVSFLLLFFSLRFRRVKNLKLFSPTLNNVAVCGCIGVYCSVILMGSDEAFEITQKYFTEVCTAKAYLLSSGFSMVFGSIFAKTYRVHKLFKNCRTSVVKTRFLKDKLLIIFILLPMMIDAIILIMWIVVDPMRRSLHNLTIETFHEIGVVHQKQVEFCGSNNTSGWYLALYGYKCFMLIIGIFMAWENRRLKIPCLDDFQYIGICIYSALFAAIMLILSNFLAENVILSYLTSSCSVILAASLTLLLLFLPQFKIILGTVKNDDLIMRSMGLKFECNTRRLIHKDQKELLHRLEIQNRVFKCELEVLDEEIKYLENLLKSVNNSKDSNSDIYTISKPNYLKMSDCAYGRASWPTSYIQSNSNEQFSSENKLNENFFERLRIFGRLKKFFDSLSSISDSESKKSMEDSEMAPRQIDDCQQNCDDIVVSVEVRQIGQVHSDDIII